MATTTTKKTAAEKAVVETSTLTNDTEARIKAQENEIAELKKMISDMLAAQNSVETVTAKRKSVKKNITFINLFPGGLTVKGNNYYHFNKQFDTNVFSENEARAIVLNMPNAARQGLFYITDAEFVEENDLEGAYESMLSDIQIKNILNLDANAVLVIYKNASDAQKKIIDGMIVNSRLNGQEIDANILIKLGEVTGKNYLEIEKMD